MAKVSIVPEFDKALFEKQVADISAAFSRIGESFDPSKNIASQLRDLESRLKVGGFDIKGAKSYAESYERDRSKLNVFNERGSAAFEKKYANTELLGVGGVVKVLEEIKTSLQLQAISEQQQAKLAAEQVEITKKSSYAGQVEAKYAQRAKTAQEMMDSSSSKREYVLGKKELEAAQKEKEDALDMKRELTPTQMMGRLGVGHYLGQAISGAANNMGEQTSANVSSAMTIGNAALSGSAFGPWGAIIAGTSAALVEGIKMATGRAASIEENFAKSNRTLGFSGQEVAYGTYMSSAQKDAFERIGMSSNDVLGAVSPLAKLRGTGKNALEEVFLQKQLEQGLGVGGGELSTINSYARNDINATRSSDAIVNLANMLEAKGVISGGAGSSFDISSLSKYIEKLGGILDKQFTMSGKTDIGAATSALGTFMSVGGNDSIFRDERTASQFLSNTQNVLANPKDDYAEYLNSQAALGAGFQTSTERMIALERGDPRIGRKRIENSIETILNTSGSGEEGRTLAGQVLSQYTGSKEKGVALFDAVVSGKGFKEGEYGTSFTKDIIAQKAMENTPSNQVSDARGENNLAMQMAGEIALSLQKVFGDYESKLGGGKTMNDLWTAVRDNGGYRSNNVPLVAPSVSPARTNSRGGRI